MALGYRTGVTVSVLAAFVLSRWGRPVAKAVIKGGMGTYESATETLARLRETPEDITAEIASEHTAAVPPGPERLEPIEQQPIATG
jgi:hypothetical protein